MPLDDIPKNKPGRKPLPATQPVTDVVDPQVAAEVSAAANELIVLEQQANERATALAVQLGYQGSLAVGALEDEIRFYQRRTVEACLELGKRLLILKEMTPHGEFKQRVELLGLSYRMAARFMSAGLKFSKSASKSLLEAAGTQTKLLELVVLDDEEIQELSEFGSVGELALDDVATMSVTELRKALRERIQQTEAKDRVIADKNERIDTLEEKLHLPWKPTPGSIAQTQSDQARLKALQDATNEVVLGVLKLASVAGSICSGDDENEPGSEALQGAAADSVAHVIARIRDVVTERGLLLDIDADAFGARPAWLDAKA